MILLRYSFGGRAERITIFVLLLFVPGFAMGMGKEDFFIAVRHSDKDRVRQFLDHGGDINVRGSDGGTALHYAIVNENMEMVEFLLDCGADVNIADKNGYTELHWAVMKDRDSDALEAITLLVKKRDVRPSLFAISYLKRTPYDVAIAWNHVCTAQFLADIRCGVMSLTKGIPTESNTNHE